MKSKTTLDKADIVIIGAGVMGASIAFQLSKRTDKRILIIDQTAPVGGMSGRTFGQIRLHYSNALLLKMAMRGYEFFRHWSAEVGFGNPGYAQMGYLLLVVENQLSPLHRNIELAQSLGINTRFVDPDEIKAIEPAINTRGLVGGAYDPAGGYIDVTRIVLSFLAASNNNGVKLLSGIKANAIETKNGQAAGIHTDSGFIEAPIVVNATGAWAGELLSQLGVDLPMEARRLDTMYLRQPPGRSQIGCCITDGNSNVAIRPDMGRDILVGAYPSEMPLAIDPGEGNNEQGDAEHLVRIKKSLAERLPDFTDAVPSRSVSGTYDITPDWHPILGWLPGFEGIYLATGFSGHGLKLAPAVGEAVTAEIAGVPSPFDLSPLRFERFAEDDLMFLAYGPGGRA